LPISFCYLLWVFFFPKVVIAMVNMAHAIALITTISCSNCLIDHMYTLMHLYIDYLHTNARFYGRVSTSMYQYVNSKLLQWLYVAPNLFLKHNNGWWICINRHIS